MSLRARVVVLPAAFPSAPTLAPHSESVAPAGDRFAPGMEFLSRPERYREVGTNLQRIFAKWQLSIAKNRDTIRALADPSLLANQTFIRADTWKLMEVQVLTPLHWHRYLFFKISIPREKSLEEGISYVYAPE